MDIVVTGSAAAIGVSTKNVILLWPKETAGQKIEYIILDDKKGKRGYMQTMNKYFSILAITLAASGSAWANGTMKPSATEECSAYSGADMRDCLEKKAKASGVELKKTENKVRNALQKWDEDAQYINTAQSKFDAASKEFLRYRDAQCGFNASLGGGAIGAALEIRKLACIVNLNVSRAQQINDAITNLPLQ